MPKKKSAQASPRTPTARDLEAQANIFSDLGVANHIPQQNVITSQIRSTYEAHTPLDFRSSIHRADFRQALENVLNRMPAVVQEMDSGEAVELLYRLTLLIKPSWRAVAQKTKEEVKKEPEAAALPDGGQGLHKLVKIIAQRKEMPESEEKTVEKAKQEDKPQSRQSKKRKAENGEYGSEIRKIRKTEIEESQKVVSEARARSLAAQKRRDAAREALKAEREGTRQKAEREAHQRARQQAVEAAKRRVQRAEEAAQRWTQQQAEEEAQRRARKGEEEAQRLAQQEAKRRAAEELEAKGWEVVHLWDREKAAKRAQEQAQREAEEQEQRQAHEQAQPQTQQQAQPQFKEEMGEEAAQEQQPMAERVSAVDQPEQPAQRESQEMQRIRRGLKPRLERAEQAIQQTLQDGVTQFQQDLRQRFQTHEREIELPTEYISHLLQQEVRRQMELGLVDPRTQQFVSQNSPFEEHAQRRLLRQLEPGIDQLVRRLQQQTRIMQAGLERQLRMIEQQLPGHLELEFGNWQQEVHQHLERFVEEIPTPTQEETQQSAEVWQDLWRRVHDQIQHLEQDIAQRLASWLVPYLEEFERRFQNFDQGWVRDIRQSREQGLTPMIQGRVQQLFEEFPRLMRQWNERERLSETPPDPSMDDNRHGPAAVPNADVHLIRADQPSNPIAFRLSDLLPRGNFRSMDGDWVDSGALEIGTMLSDLRRAYLMDGDDEVLWWCPWSLQEMDHSIITSAQSGETLLTEINVSSTIRRSIEVLYPEISRLSPNSASRRLSLNRPSFTIIIRSRNTRGDESSSQDPQTQREGSMPSERRPRRWGEDDTEDPAQSVKQVLQASAARKHPLAESERDQADREAQRRRLNESKGARLPERLPVQKQFGPGGRPNPFADPGPLLSPSEHARHLSMPQYKAPSPKPGSVREKVRNIMNGKEATTLPDSDTAKQLLASKEQLERSGAEWLGTSQHQPLQIQKAVKDAASTRLIASQTAAIRLTGEIAPRPPQRVPFKVEDQVFRERGQREAEAKHIRFNETREDRESREGRQTGQERPRTEPLPAFMSMPTTSVTSSSFPSVPFTLESPEIEMTDTTPPRSPSPPVKQVEDPPPPELQRKAEPEGDVQTAVKSGKKSAETAGDPVDGPAPKQTSWWNFWKSR